MSRPQLALWLSLFAVALAWPARADNTRLEFQAGGALDVRTLTAEPLPLTPPVGHWLGGSSIFGVTVFHHALADSVDPPPLQPFLQRAARFHVEAGAGSAEISYPAWVFNSQSPSSYLAQYRSSERHAALDTWADGYVGRRLYLAAHLRLDVAHWEPSPFVASPGTVLEPFVDSEIIANASLSAGVRWRELLLFLGYGATPYRIGEHALTVRFWGGAFVGLHAVVRRLPATVDLTARIEVLDRGASAEAEATFWGSRRVGFAVGAQGGHGAFADSPVLYDRAGGHVGITWWMTPRLAASVTYAPLWQHAAPVDGLGSAQRQFSFVAHLLTLTVIARQSDSAAK